MLGNLLTDIEADLLLEVLRAESDRLMIEARRTDARKMRKEIRERLRAVERIIERFQELRADAQKV